MKKTFFNLPAKRRAEIKRVCMEEFIAHGYDNASINRMIKSLGVAKGSFYNYTSSKEDLYLFLLRDIYAEASELQGNLGTYHTADLFDRIEDLLIFGIEMCRNNPLQYKFLLQGDLDVTSSVHFKVMAIRREMFQRTFSALFENVNWDQYRFSREDVIAIFSWLSAGVQEDLRTRVNAGMEVDEYEQMVRHRLAIYKESLRRGVYKRICSAIHPATSESDA